MTYLKMLTELSQCKEGRVPNPRIWVIETLHNTIKKGMEMSAIKNRLTI